MSDQVSNERKTSEERADRELIELLNDLRVALPACRSTTPERQEHPQAAPDERSSTVAHDPV